MNLPSRLFRPISPPTPQEPPLRAGSHCPQHPPMHTLIASAPPQKKQRVLKGKVVKLLTLVFKRGSFDSLVFTSDKVGPENSPPHFFFFALHNKRHQQTISSALLLFLFFICDVL